MSQGPGSRPPSQRLRRRARVDDHRLARLRHRALLDLGEVGGEQREAVRRVAEEVASDEHVGDVAGDVVAHA